VKITSPTNQKIKDVVKLRERRGRTKAGVTVIEGIREVRAAIGAGVLFQDVFICPELYEGQAKGSVESEILKPLAALKVPVTEVTAEVFEKLSFGDRREGVLAVGEPLFTKLKDLKAGKNSLLMVIEHVEKPGNLGAILRTCDAVGINALLVCDPATDIFNPNVIRASLGTVFYIPILAVTNEEALSFLKNITARVIAATPQGKKVYTAADYRGTTAIVVGSEKDGLSDFWLKAAEEKVLIPMKGRADSLNTSVAAAVISYEAIRQRAKE